MLDLQLEERATDLVPELDVREDDRHAVLIRGERLGADLAELVGNERDIQLASILVAKRLYPGLGGIKLARDLSVVDRVFLCHCHQGVIAEIAVTKAIIVAEIRDADMRVWVIATFGKCS